MRSIRLWRFLGVCLLLAGAGQLPAAEPTTGDDAFETRIRPLLAESCWSCHGPDKQFGGLRLDSREAMLTGGDSGPALEPSKPDESLLIEMISLADGDPQMPPKKPLTAEQVATLSAWVEAGAPWPASATPTTPTARKAADHWAFQPVQTPELPSVRDPSWARNPIDLFILSKLEGAGLSPSAPADRPTLIRRLTYDLTGLPPTEAEIAAFVSDQSIHADSRLIDRLLASPRYGERWGRHWLDVARYADTKGYVFQEERRYPYSYTYRDWVIQAYNRDLPFDQFILQQLAADKLARDGNGEDLAAMGFLTVGRRFLNKQEDIIDDRIDVTTRGFLGLTVACARCHDHKYDPVPIDDYYSLYGVFASSREPEELPLIPGGQSTESYRQERERRQAEVDDYLAKQTAALAAELRGRVAEYLLAAFDLGFDPRGSKLDELCKVADLRPELVRSIASRWPTAVKQAQDNPSALLHAWSRLSALPSDRFQEEAAAISQSPTWGPGDPLAAAILSPSAPASLREAAERLGAFLQKAATSDAPELAPVRAWLDLNGGPLAITGDEVPRLLRRDERTALRDRERKVDELDASHEGAPPRAMVMVDRDSLYNPYVFQRGNPGRRGADVPRQFLKVLSPDDRKPFENGSGRLDLARAIASPTNPLTARVLVNRLWMHHFGQGLVRTPSDFGLRSDPPSHPELLDWLASELVRQGWSIKAMHRLILLSSTYQQSSANRSEPRASDPENLLLWRQNRRRLELEPLRDSLLAASGRLDGRMGGRGASIADPPFSPRRSVYAFIDRQNLDAVFRTFDLASPDASSPKRFETTVPQQALFMLNHPFVAEQARTLAARPEIITAADDAARITWLHRHLFGRAAEQSEIDRARQFLNAVADTSGEPPTGIWLQGWGRWQPGAPAVEFQPFPRWTGAAWQFNDKLPDPTHRYLHLTAGGGHVGSGELGAAIRRWVSPVDGVIEIAGTLSHKGTGGDGVRARVVAAHGGLLGEWIAERSDAPTTLARYEVKQGETIDFLTDGRADDSFDGFQWAPVVRLVEPSTHAATFASNAGFEGPPPPRLTPWEQYAQVLLLTNEFAFVD